MIQQIIDEESPPPSIESQVRGFIFTDEDGSRRVNVAGLTAWLAEQFSYLPAVGMSLTAKSALAASIASNLQNAIGREAFRTRPDYPKANTATVNTAVQNKLIELRESIQDDARKINLAYNAFSSRNATAMQSLFNSTVAESIVGTKLTYTTRGYIETFVTDLGEESRPSAPSALVNLDQNDYATVQGAAPPAGRFITKRRLYVTATGDAGSSYRLVGEYPIATTEMMDVNADTALGEACATFGWLEPPAALSGLVGMSNGLMLGFAGSTLHCCEPYVPYAWPAAYDKPLPHKIIGIASLGQSALVGTTAYPFVVTGSDAASLTEQKLKNLVPCASGRSMVSIGNAVFYASTDGLALYENGEVSVVTEGIIDRAAWAAYNPASMFGAGFDGKYFAFYRRANDARGCLVFDYMSRTISELDQSADAACSDESGLYVLGGTQIADLLPASGAARTGQWHSKTFVLGRPQNFSWLQVDGAFTNNGAPTSATVRVYADGVLLHTAVVPSIAAVRLPPGRFMKWRVEIESSAQINGVILASTTEELKEAV